MIIKMSSGDASCVCVDFFAQVVVVPCKFLCHLYLSMLDIITSQQASRLMLRCSNKITLKVTLLAGTNFMCFYCIYLVLI